MRALLALGLATALLALACGGSNTGSCSAECDDLWKQADACWKLYCQLDHGNTLFCSQCLSAGQTLDGETCTCSGIAKDSFMDACCGQEPGKARFDCAEDKKRLTDLSEKWQCCGASSDCASGTTCGPDNRCK
jgi:hypothetical protein